MFSWLFKLLLTFSSAAPIGLVYAWVSYQQNQTFVAIISFCVSMFAVAACITSLHVAKSKLEKIPFRPRSIESADSENVGFILLYSLPLFTDQIKELRWEALAPIIFIFLLTTMSSNAYHFNPMLSLLRWHFYKVEDQSGVTFVLVTRRYLRRANDTMRVAQLTDYMMIDLEE